MPAAAAWLSAVRAPPAPRSPERQVGRTAPPPPPPPPPALSTADSGKLRQRRGAGRLRAPRRPPLPSARPPEERRSPPLLPPSLPGGRARRRRGAGPGRGGAAQVAAAQPGKRLPPGRGPSWQPRPPRASLAEAYLEPPSGASQRQGAGPSPRLQTRLLAGGRAKGASPVRDGDADAPRRGSCRSSPASPQPRGHLAAGVPPQPSWRLVRGWLCASSPGGGKGRSNGRSACWGGVSGAG